MGPATAELFVEEERARLYHRPTPGTARRRHRSDRAPDFEEWSPTPPASMTSTASSSTIRSEAGRETAGQSPVPNARARRPAFQWWRGFRTITHLRAINPTKLLVTGLALCSRPDAALLELRRPVVGVPRNSQPGRTFGFTRRRRRGRRAGPCMFRAPSTGNDGNGDAAAININHGAVHEARLVASQVDRGVSDLIGRTAASGGRIVHHRLGGMGVTVDGWGSDHSR